MTKTINMASYAALALIVCGLLYVLGVQTQMAFASAPSGLPAQIRSATTTAVGPQQNITIFAASSNCASRIIRTQGAELYLTFGETVPTGDLASTTLSAVAGFLQAASTTVAYDSGIYGCGRVTAEANASSTITVAEMQ